MQSKTRSRRLLPVVMLIVGVGIASLLYATRQGPPVRPSPPAPRLVRTFRAVATPHRIAVTAYGTTQASQQWTAISEVSGTIAQLSDRFAAGDVIPAGELLATIDKLDYELAVKRAQTEVTLRKQKQLELVQTRENTLSMIEVREKQFQLAQAELDRVSELIKNNASSQAEYDRVSGTYLDRDLALKELKNRLALLPIQEQSEATAMEAAQLNLQQVQRDLEQCEIRAPFNALCISRDVTLHEQATTGQVLGEFLGLERAEIIAMIEPRKALPLFRKFGKAIGPIDFRSPQLSLLNELRRQIREFAIPVDVTWRAGEGIAQWRGRLVRASATVDESTRSIPFIVEVDDAFSAVEIGIKPALVPGMFVETVIYGDRYENVFVIPRDVVRGGTVHVVRDDRLAIVDVELLAIEEDAAIVESGLNEGDQVILADLFPVAEGMSLRAEDVPNPVKPRLEIPAFKDN